MSVRDTVSLALCFFVRASVPVCAPPGRVQRAVREAVLWLRLFLCALVLVPVVCACNRVIYKVTYNTASVFVPRVCSAKLALKISYKNYML